MFFVKTKVKNKKSKDSKKNEIDLSAFNTSINY